MLLPFHFLLSFFTSNFLLSFFQFRFNFVMSKFQLLSLSSILFLFSARHFRFERVEERPKLSSNSSFELNRVSRQELNGANRLYFLSKFVSFLSNKFSNQFYLTKLKLNVATLTCSMAANFVAPFSVWALVKTQNCAPNNKLVLYDQCSSKLSLSLPFRCLSLVVVLAN